MTPLLGFRLLRPDLALRHRGLDKRGWVGLLRASGLDEPARERWHAAFEPGGANP